MSPPTGRRWQRGESAICTCDDQPPLEVPVVGGALRGYHPTVERGGVEHRCLTAQYAAAKIGRPRRSEDTRGDLARVSPELAERARAAARAQGATERQWIELAISEKLSRS